MDDVTAASRASMVAEVFDRAQVVTTLSSSDRDKLFALALEPGFAVLIGALLGERQTTLMQLSYAKASDPAQVQALGVLQGTIRGIERVHAILLESTQVPTEDQG